MVSTVTSCNNRLSLARPTLKVAHAGRNRSLMARNNNSLPTQTGVGHQWMVNTVTGCNNWLSLATLTLKVAYTSRNRSLWPASVVAHPHKLVRATRERWVQHGPILELVQPVRAIGCNQCWYSPMPAPIFVGGLLDVQTYDRGRTGS